MSLTNTHNSSHVHPRMEVTLRRSTFTEIHNRAVLVAPLGISLDRVRNARGLGYLCRERGGDGDEMVLWGAVMLCPGFVRTLVSDEERGKRRRGREGTYDRHLATSSSVGFRAKALFHDHVEACTSPDEDAYFAVLA